MNFIQRLSWVGLGILIAIALNYFFTSTVSLGIGLGIISGMLLENYVSKHEISK